MLVGDGQFFLEGGHYSLVNYVLGGGTIFPEGGQKSLVNSVQGRGTLCRGTVYTMTPVLHNTDREKKRNFFQAYNSLSGISQFVYRYTSMSGLQA